MSCWGGNWHHWVPACDQIKGFPMQRDLHKHCQAVCSIGGFLCVGGSFGNQPQFLKHSTGKLLGKLGEDG